MSRYNFRNQIEFKTISMSHALPQRIVVTVNLRLFEVIFIETRSNLSLLSAKRCTSTNSFENRKLIHHYIARRFSRRK